MSTSHDSGPTGSATRAVERVLRAERDAETNLALTRQQAQALLESAREDALAIVNRAMERIARWQRSHAEALERRLGALRAQAAASASTEHAADESAIVAAVEQVARLLTTEADAGTHDGAS